MRLGSLAWPKLPATAPVLLLPLGATEQHGPHLPLETDTTIATALAEAVAAQRADVVVAPALAYGSSGEHAGFPGTLSLGQGVLERAVVELCRSADSFRGVVLVSWHGGNVVPLRRAVRRLRLERRRASAWVPSVPDADLHAGRTETSLMLAIAPHLVGDDRPVGTAGRLDWLLPIMKAHGVRAVSASGVLGDARGATARDGRRLLEKLAGDLAAFVDSAAPATVPA